MKRVFLDLSRCTGCRSCELACAVQHSRSQNLFEAIFESPPPRKRTYLESIDGIPYPGRCMHCSEAPCIEVCPVSAMYREEEFQTVRVDKERCMGCLMCAMVCPNGVIGFDPYKGVAIKCGLCRSRLREGRVPACVESCPTGALSFGEFEELERQKRLRTARVVLKAVKLAEQGTLPIYSERTGGE